MNISGNSAPKIQNTIIPFHHFSKIVCDSRLLCYYVCLSGIFKRIMSRYLHTTTTHILQKTAGFQEDNIDEVGERPQGPNLLPNYSSTAEILNVWARALAAFLTHSPNQRKGVAIIHTHRPISLPKSFCSPS